MAHPINNAANIIARRKGGESRAVESFFIDSIRSLFVRNFMRDGVDYQSASPNNGAGKNGNTFISDRGQWNSDLSTVWRDKDVC